MHRATNLAIAFFLGSLTMAAYANVGQAPVPPPMPAWVASYCADASPCTPAQVVNGISFQQVALELDGSVCPAPAPGGSIGTACVGPPSGAHWLLLTRGDVQHGQNAIDHDVIFASTLPIYGPGIHGPAGSDINLWGSGIGLGAVLVIGMPPNAVAAQAPQFPAPTPADTEAWFAAACLNDPTCSSGGSMTQAMFDAFLSTSPYSSHNHPFGATLVGTNTVNGVPVADAVQINGITGVPQ